jgi:tRNA (guanine-N7-)-methyltransferase
MAAPPPAGPPRPDTPGEGGPGWRTFYGRRSGKTLKAHQRDWLNSDLAALVPAGIAVRENPQRHPIDPGAIFGDARPLWLEIGFGAGEHLVAMAAANPAVGLIGAEPFVNGVAVLLGKLRAAGVGNVALYPGDVRDLFEVLPAASIARAWLNYPDPWPKRRHRERRFVNAQTLALLARVMQPGAELRLATDIADYAAHARRTVPAAGFAPQSDGADPWDGWVRTRYEAKALREGRAPQYLVWRRL